MFSGPLCLAAQHSAAVAGQMRQAKRGESVEGKVGRTGKPSDIPDRGPLNQDADFGKRSIIANGSERARPVIGIGVQWHLPAKLRCGAGDELRRSAVPPQLATGSPWSESARAFPRICSSAKMETNAPNAYSLGPRHDASWQPANQPLWPGAHIA